MKKNSDNKTTSILKKEFTIPFFNMKTMKKIFKKNRKKSNIYKRKRKTFAGLFAKNTAMGIFLTVVFAVGLYVWGIDRISSLTRHELEATTSAMQQFIDKAENDKMGDSWLTSRLRMYSSYNLYLHEKCQINPQYTENCTALTAIFDEDNNIIYSSSKEDLTSFIVFSKDEKYSMMCNTEALNIPELNQLYEDYKALKTDNGIHFKLKSAYVNTESMTFIPHEIEMLWYELYVYDAPVETKQYNITVDMDGYELVEFNDTAGRKPEYPYNSMCNFFGTDKQEFNKLINDNNLSAQIRFENASGFYGESDTSGIYYRIQKVWLGGGWKKLVVAFKIDAWNNMTKPLYFKFVALFLLAMLIIAFLDAWRHNVKNKADYMFEDYQKNLTDSLAHDLKTPLMAIGGYAENILSGSLSGEEINKYLSSIMDNVSYTDSIITRTLELNSMNSINIKREQADVYKLAGDAIEKYSLMLDERNITVNINGKAEISTDVCMLKTILENLISNAVKYTPENGKVSINISNRSLRITNTVGKKIDVKDLKKPFIKGDEARSNQSGSGLGLAIAETAALLNGFKLVISCTDSEFTAELKF